MEDLISYGLKVNNYDIKVKFGLCILDSPARALIKGNIFEHAHYLVYNHFILKHWKIIMLYHAGTVNFNHTNGCQKCYAIGTYDKASHRMCYPTVAGDRRTDQSFRARSQPSHHKEDSPPEDLDIDMIWSVSSSDPLHCVDLGVMKKCLQRWTGKTKQYPRKWKKQTTESVSRFLFHSNKYMPSDIHRSLRSLEVLSFWKGSEFRTMLLYVGMVAL